MVLVTDLLRGWLALVVCWVIDNLLLCIFVSWLDIAVLFDTLYSGDM